MVLVGVKIHDSNLSYIEYSFPVFDDFLMVMSLYNYTDHMAETDLLDAYLQFPVSYYLSTFITFLAFVLTWKSCARAAGKLSRTVRRQLRNARLPSYWIMVCAILDQDQYPTVSRVAFTILSFCFSLFFFITVDCFILNTMTTDLVVIDEPATIGNYDQAIAREGLKVGFMRGMDEIAFFRDAKEGSKERQIWDKSMVLDSVTFDTIGQLWGPGMGQKLVSIFRGWITHLLLNIGITKTRQMGLDYVRALAVKDETGKYFTNAWMVHAKAPQALKHYLHRR